MHRFGKQLREPVNTAPKIIEGQYFQDLMAQPQALRATLAWLSQSGSLGGGA